MVDHESSPSSDYFISESYLFFYSISPPWVVLALYGSLYQVRPGTSSLVRNSAVGYTQVQVSIIRKMFDLWKAQLSFRNGHR